MVFVQFEHRMSVEGVLLGLNFYFQEQNLQGKLAHVVHGGIFDVTVDSCKNSKAISEA